MTSLKKKSAGTFGAKAEFIRSQPDQLSAREIVEAAKKRGLQITVNHVYNIRAAKRTQLAAERPKKRRGSPVSPHSNFTSHRRDAGEIALRRAIAEIGLARAREIFDSVAAVFDGEH